MIDIGNKTVYMGGAMPEEKGTSGSGLELLDTLESFNLNFIPGGVTPEEWATVYGPSPLLLPKAKANGLQYVKAFGGTEQSGTPTPDAPMDIVSNNGAIKYSANMANVNAQTVLTGYYISSSGVLTADANNWIYQSFIPVKPNTTYTLSLSSAVYYVTISEYSTADDSGFIVRNAGSSGANTTLTITTQANTNFVRFGTNIDRTEVTLEEVLAINCMLNEGSTAIPYAPYAEGGIYTDGTVETIEDTIGNTATAEMLLKVDDYQDIQSILDGAVTKNVGVNVLDGTESWQLGSSSERPFYLNSSIDGSYALPNTPFCTHFQGVASTVASLDMPDLTIRCGYEGFARSLYIKYKGLYSSGVAAFKQFLADQYAAGTPVVVIYPLATATTETVTGQTLQVQKGDNTLEITQASLNNLTLEAKYRRNK